MIIRNYLKECVCGLCILAIISFLMVFVITMTLIDKLNNRIQVYAPMTMNNMTAWAQIPGALDYTYTKTMYLFNVQEFNSETKSIEMESYGPYDYSVARNLTNPVYDDARKVVNYTMDYEYTLMNDRQSILDANITTLNLDGASAWYQMNENAPEFWRSWQAMVLASSTMQEAQMLNSLYSWQAYYYCFKYTSCVQEVVLPESVNNQTYFTPSQFLSIYHDDVYGMDESTKLVIWVIAADSTNSQSSVAQ